MALGDSFKVTSPPRPEILDQKKVFLNGSLLLTLTKTNQNLMSYGVSEGIKQGLISSPKASLGSLN